MFKLLTIVKPGSRLGFARGAMAAILALAAMALLASPASAVNCPSGYFATGPYLCEPCPDGTYSLFGTNLGCRACPAGYFANPKHTGCIHMIPIATCGMLGLPPCKPGGVGAKKPPKSIACRGGTVPNADGTACGAGPPAGSPGLLVSTPGSGTQVPAGTGTPAGVGGVKGPAGVK